MLMEFDIGDVLFDMYRVIEVIRTGGFGIVYICERISGPSQKVAVKTFKDEYFEDEETINRFYHEAEVWIKLGSHVNIVRADVVMSIEGKPHVFMEYVDGGNLGDWIEDKRLSLFNISFFAHQFCEGMIYANNKDLGEGKIGIVHRDIKPGNMMLTKGSNLKITDFGLVKAIGSPTTETPAGTPEYMSPEQFITMDVDQRSDIYSFGVVLYEMIFGRRPFPEPENPRLRLSHFKHCHQNMVPMFPTLRKEIDPRLYEYLQRWIDVISKCLQKNPTDRYQSFEEIKSELI